MIADLITEVQGCRLELEENKLLEPQVPDPMGLELAEFECFVRCCEIKAEAKEALLKRETKKAAKVKQDAEGGSRQAKKGSSRQAKKDSSKQAKEGSSGQAKKRKRSAA